MKIQDIVFAVMSFDTQGLLEKTDKGAYIRGEVNEIWNKQTNQTTM